MLAQVWKERRSDGTPDRDGPQRPEGRPRRAADDDVARGPDHDGPRLLADHGHVLRRPRPQQRDRPGVVLLDRAPVPVRRDHGARPVDHAGGRALSGRGRRRGAPPDDRLRGDPGRLRRRDHRPRPARPRRPDRPHLAQRVRLRGRRRRDLQPAAPDALLRRPARVLDRHPLDVGEGRHRARPPHVRARDPVDDPLHRRRRLHHDVPVGVHDERHADHATSSTTSRASTTSARTRPSA